EAKAMFQASVSSLVAFSQRTVFGLHNGSLQRYLAFMIGGAIAIGFVAFLSVEHGAGTRPTLAITPVALVGWLLLVGCCVTAVVLHRQRVLALVAVGVVGLIVSLGFIYFAAPDLALTQISVEVVTVILILLALYFIPKTTP